MSNHSNTERLLKAGDVIARAEVVPEEDLEEPKEFQIPEPIDTSEIITDKTVSETDRADLMKLIEEHRNCFVQHISEIGCTHLTRMNIQEVKGSKPTSQKPYRTNR